MCPSMTVQPLKLSILPAFICTSPAQVFGQGPLQGMHSPFTAFLLDGQARTQAPLSFNKCSGQFLTHVAPYAYFPLGFGSHEYDMGL